MRERPILFSAPMVRAILEGRKTQTRRIVKPRHEPDGVYGCDPWIGMQRLYKPDEAPPPGSVPWWNLGGINGAEQRCPHGQPGDRLWVREAWNWCYAAAKDASGKGAEDRELIDYAADGHPSVFGFKWRPSIHMPRWASRILLEIVAVRVERLQDISEEDALAEGVYADAACNGMFTADGNTYTTKQDGAAGAYAELWESINGPSSWAANPWVWVVEFKKVSPGETAGVTP